MVVVDRQAGKMDVIRGAVFTRGFESFRNFQLKIALARGDLDSSGRRGRYPPHREVACAVLSCARLQAVVMVV